MRDYIELKRVDANGIVVFLSTLETIQPVGGEGKKGD